MTCKLCGNESKLVDSHIIPQWAYKIIKDEKRKLSLLSTNSVATKKSNTGVYDKIFCIDCENLFSSIDTRAHCLFKNTTPTVVNLGKLDVYQYESKHKSTAALFIQSILLRAHHSSNEMFEHVNLGKYANIYLDCLKNDRHYHKCNIFIAKMKTNNELEHIIHSPLKIRIQNKTSYHFRFDSYMAILYPGNDAPRKNDTKILDINQSDNLNISELPDNEFYKQILPNIMAIQDNNKKSLLRK